MKLSNKFPLGQVVATAGLYDFLEEKGKTQTALGGILLRHANGDWGELPEGDRELNDYAIINGDRILSSYTVLGEKVWVVTEADRSITTILFPHEY